jgi:hypothetical protein
MEEDKNYKIVAQSLEEFKWLEAGYEKLIKNFSITGANILLVKKGFFLSDDKKLIDISPLIGSPNIQGVRKYSSDSKFNLVGSSMEKWDIQGKDCDYIIRAKRLESLL